MEWEVNLIEWLQKTVGDLNDVFISALGFLGGEMGLLLLVLIILFCWRKESGKRLALIIAAVNSWLPMIKSVVLRPRPYMEHPDRVRGVADVGNNAPLNDVAAHGYSFPSMHSASAMALFVSLANEVKKKWMWILASVIIFLVGLSRSVTGMHYPTDVLAGWTLGLICVWICMRLEKKVKSEWTRHLILLATVLPGLFYVRTDDYFTALGLMIGIIFAIHFEERFVNFSDTRNLWAKILRVIGAFAIYLVMNTLLKMPFSAEFLTSGTLGAFLIRTARYAIIVFVMIGVYPMVFPLFEKIGKKGNDDT